MKLQITRRVLFTLLLAASFGAGTAKAEVLRPGPRPANAEVWGRTELYFGTSKPDGGTVSDEEFQQFVDDEITPRFPDGLTLLSGYGQFLNSSGVLVQEQSKLLILFYPSKDGETNRKIQAIRETYKYKFQQESVLRVDSLGLISF